MQLSQRLADWASALTWTDIPAAVQQRGLDNLRDVVSVMFAGTPTKSAQIAATVARRSAGTVPLAAGGSACQHLAAFANGVAASALDYDDGHTLAGAIHGSAPTIAGALAAATPETTVRDFVTAQVAGLEISLRAGSLLWMKHPADWYHAAGCAGALGAAGASAHLLGLSPDALRRSLAIAWQHAPMASGAWPMVKEAIGWGAATGVTAALLAEAGWMNMDGGMPRHTPHFLPDTPFDRAGVEEDAFVNSFGSVFESANTYFKPYASCRYTHSPAYGVNQLMAKADLAPSDIESIRIGTFEFGADLSEAEPGSLEHLQYSIPNVVAAMVLHGNVGPHVISEERLFDPARLELASRVGVVHDADLDHHYPRRYPSRVTIRTTDGQVLEGVFPEAPDDDESVRLTSQQLDAKWMEALSVTIPSTVARTTLELLGNPDATLLESLAPAFASVAVTLG